MAWAVNDASAITGRGIDAISWQFTVAYDGRLSIHDSSGAVILLCPLSGYMIRMFDYFISLSGTSLDGEELPVGDYLCRRLYFGTLQGRRFPRIARYRRLSIAGYFDAATMAYRPLIILYVTATLALFRPRDMRQRARARFPHWARLCVDRDIGFISGRIASAEQANRAVARHYGPDEPQARYLEFHVTATL